MSCSGGHQGYAISPSFDVSPPVEVIAQIGAIRQRHTCCVNSLSPTWYQARGTNVIDAIALLLSPVNSTTLSDTDYYRRDIDTGFVIEAVASLPPGSGIHDQLKPAWPSMMEWTEFFAFQHLRSWRVRVVCR